MARGDQNATGDPSVRKQATPYPARVHARDRHGSNPLDCMPDEAQHELWKDAQQYAQGGKHDLGHDHGYRHFLYSEVLISLAEED